MSVLPEVIYRFGSISIKIPRTISLHKQKNLSKVTENLKEIQITETILRKNKTGSPII